MRKIKFRGYSRELNDWVYGFLVKREDGDFIYVTDVIWLQSNGYKGLGRFFMVEPESIEQYTEIKDALGKEIYEEDVIEVVNDCGEIAMTGIVYFKDGKWCLFDVDISSNNKEKEGYFDLFSIVERFATRIAHNIFDVKLEQE